MGQTVPDVLLSGHHANIDKWRLEASEKLTEKRRPDLYSKYYERKMAAEAAKKKKRRRKTAEQ